mmetsp:Transcript_28371/g.47949  ORF Transcript_28371/g.47949 Transcript_28371/m.47949 type:complete len:255 (+) Transcript_28371:286-1050(+)
MGNNWKEIAKLLPGRCGFDCCNHFRNTSSMKRLILEADEGISPRHTHSGPQTKCVKKSGKCAIANAQDANFRCIDGESCNNGKLTASLQLQNSNCDEEAAERTVEEYSALSDNGEAQGVTASTYLLPDSSLCQNDQLTEDGPKHNSKAIEPCAADADYNIGQGPTVSAELSSSLATDGQCTSSLPAVRPALRQNPRQSTRSVHGAGTSKNSRKTSPSNPGKSSRSKPRDACSSSIVSKKRKFVSPHVKTDVHPN